MVLGLDLSMDILGIKIKLVAAWGICYVGVHGCMDALNLTLTLNVRVNLNQL
jgi:hypothetical protein